MKGHQPVAITNGNGRRRWVLRAERESDGAVRYWDRYGGTTTVEWLLPDRYEAGTMGPWKAYVGDATHWRTRRSVLRYVRRFVRDSTWSVSE